MPDADHKILAINCGFALISANSPIVKDGVITLVPATIILHNDWRLVGVKNA